jgi:hypothetical protein
VKVNASVNEVVTAEGEIGTEEETKAVEECKTADEPETKILTMFPIASDLEVGYQSLLRASVFSCSLSSADAQPGSMMIPSSRPCLCHSSYSWGFWPWPYPYPYSKSNSYCCFCFCSFYHQSVDRAFDQNEAASRTVSLVPWCHDADHGCSGHVDERRHYE